jgi:hypothetical protein
MTDPDREHTTEPAEGAEQPGEDEGTGRTPHPEQPAEGREFDAEPVEPPETPGEL